MTVIPDPRLGSRAWRLVARLGDKSVEKIGLLHDFQGARPITGLYYQGLRVDITSQRRKSTGHKDSGVVLSGASIPRMAALAADARLLS
jgi:hypothetical protein